ncbi:hypothetical protein PPSIR1_37539 [Plesiocystis pacifica SIR-1]|uniref:DUF2330 domain-containing protein n=1 Tax=Plesiocystis pacifica SIR-1 TaxID=391625 RepID=A6GB33_9BACT|nr:DUF2330 domain-containing protein [Plesiocystis pacifica]EDM76915.1 hypothetical protein PPSIR1_37539 [Plesiocystis pacifica SIR-1]
MIDRQLNSRLTTLAATAALTCASALAAFSLAPSQAEACGGTFCDAGPQVMPVDQSGENILFWIDQNEGEPHTEAHIQIQYEGDAERFAWLIPVMEVPEVLVGSQALFDRLLGSTVPTFTINTRFDGDCGGVSGIGCGFALEDASVAGGGDEASNGTFGQEDDVGGVDVIDRGFAGAFEYVVLTGTSVEEIVTWLDDAGYAQDEDAPPILQEYLDEDFKFVAVKLKSGAGVDEIHPLAIRYPGIEPCVPIRLTRIAATEDMAIRTFFLGQSRAAPQNWPHVSLNLLGLDWTTDPSADYNELVSLAVDEAGGRAFVTEYAGTDSVVDPTGIFNTDWNSAAFAEVEPVNAVALLGQQGLASCNYATRNGEACEFFHPQVRPLLEKYLPAPVGVEPLEYWDDLGGYEEFIDMEAWNTSPGFAAEFEERISMPAEHAIDMLDDASYLTRLFTLLSPHEMLEDPLFHEVTDLGTVDNNITATRVFSCDESPDYFEFTDGRTLALEDSINYPTLEGMPLAERIELVPMMGPPQVQTDNGAIIDDFVDEWNSDRILGPSAGCSVTRVRAEAILSFMAIFGIAWFQRRRRRDA